MLTIITTTWGIFGISFFMGSVLGYGFGYDANFKNKIEIQRDSDYLLLHRKEMMQMAKREIEEKNPYKKPMTKEFIKKSRSLAVKIGVHHDC